MRAELARMIEAHRRMLDQLATGVAMFAADRKLAFYNAAFSRAVRARCRFSRPVAYRQRVARHVAQANKLPEQQNFRQWKHQLHGAYRAGAERADVVPA